MKTPEINLKADWSTPALVTALLVTINAVAIYGQAQFFYTKTHDWVSAVGIAAVIELIGVYLAHMTHKFLMADQSPGLARPGAYAVGFLAAGLNYEHWSVHDKTLGLTFAVLSALSPFLWSVWTRYRNRNRLSELGALDARGLRLSSAKKLFHPIKSIKLMSFAAWESISDVETAKMAMEVSEEELSEPVSGIPVGNKLDEMRRIMAEAETIVSAGGTWEEAARKVGKTSKTLRNYRKAISDADS
jgi:hypothetical protein